MNEILHVIDRGGAEKAIYPEELWQYLPDGTQEEFVIYDINALPYDEWQQGDGS